MKIHLLNRLSWCLLLATLFFVPLPRQGHVRASRLARVWQTTDPVEKLLKQSKEAASRNFARAVELARKACLLAKDNPAVNLQSRINAHLVLAGLMLEQSNFNEASQLFHRAARLAREQNHSAELMAALLGLHEIQNKQHHQQLAQSYLQDALVLARQTGKNDLLWRALLQSGTFYYALFEQQGDAVSLEKSQDFYAQALSCAASMNDTARMVQVNRRIASVLYDMGDSEQAEILLQKCLDMLQERGAPSTATLADTELQLAMIYKQRNPEKALKWFEEGIKSLEAADKRQEFYRVWFQMGQVHSQLGQLGTAEYYFEACRLEAANAGLKSWQLKCHQELLKLYAATGNYRQAYEQQQRFIALKDSVFNERSNVRMAELEARYRSDQQQQEIGLLQQRMEVEHAKTGILLAGLAGTVVVAFLLYLGFRLKQKAGLHLQAKNCQIEQQNRELLELNEEKNHLISVVAHDLKNPVSVSMSLTDLVLSEADKLEEDHREAIQITNRSLKRMNAMIGRILDIRRIEASQQNTICQYFDLREAVLSALQQVAVPAQAKQVQLLPRLPGRPLQVWADPDFTVQVLENLLSNAIKFSDPDKKVWIAAKVQTNEVIVEVRDQGPGIDPREQKQLFKTFQRLSARPTAGEHSSGLGLSIVKKFTEAMHGRVWCESQPGKGSTFKVALRKQASRAACSRQQLS